MGDKIYICVVSNGIYSRVLLALPKRVCLRRLKDAHLNKDSDSPSADTITFEQKLFYSIDDLYFLQHLHTNRQILFKLKQYCQSNVYICRT